MGCIQSAKDDDSTDGFNNFNQKFYQTPCRANQRSFSMEKIPISKVRAKEKDYITSTSLENLMLSEIQSPMPRWSTLKDEFCVHCLHHHMKACCLYFDQSEEDGFNYAQWKYYLETSTEVVFVKNFDGIPEAIAGQTTPDGYPRYSYKYPDEIELNRYLLRSSYITLEKIGTKEYINRSYKKWTQYQAENYNKNCVRCIKC